jgi:hypothetical protein
MLLPPQSTAINVARQATRSVSRSLRISTDKDHPVDYFVLAKMDQASLIAFSLFMRFKYMPFLYF